MNDSIVKPESYQIQPSVLQEVIRRIVEVAAPEKLILFGSATHREIGPNSDLDILVVKSGAHRRKLAQAIYLHLSGIGQAVESRRIFRPTCFKSS